MYEDNDLGKLLEGVEVDFPRYRRALEAKDQRIALLENALATQSAYKQGLLEDSADQIQQLKAHILRLSGLLEEARSLASEGPASRRFLALAHAEVEHGAANA